MMMMIYFTFQPKNKYEIDASTKIILTNYVKPNELNMNELR